jgi:hypothetical protein
MKKTLIPLVLLAVLVLAACSNSASSGSGANGTPGAFGSGPLSSPLDLLVGTFKLEGTNNAVTHDEASALIPLWQAYASLTSSNTAAQQEIDALVQQIHDTMTPEQVKAIQDMKLTGQDMFALMQDQGLSFGNRPRGTAQPGGGGFPGGGGGFQGTRTNGGDGFPRGGGGFPGGGGFGQGNGQNLTPQQQATIQAFRAERANGGGFNRVPAPLINALVKLLQSK